MGKYDPDTLEQIKESLDLREDKQLDNWASRSSAAIRRNPEDDLESGYRQSYAVDADRILHARAYARYIDKTQVFYLVQNDHITHRVLHVQLVSKIARTIGRYLKLNEDLIEAVALGHDIGHSPFGHDGETILSSLCHQAGIGYFLHNVQSVQFLDRVEQKGRGWNLTLQTLDGILCHDGEIHNQLLVPQFNKTFEEFESELSNKKKDPKFRLIPMTPEGCVVRLADTISYIGRDIEDAIRLKVIDRQELPKEVTEVLGDTNGKIVYQLVTDLIKCSLDADHIGFSHEISEVLMQLKKFNLERIYLNPKVKTGLPQIEKMFLELFDGYLADLKKGNHHSVIYQQFLNDKSSEYCENHNHAEVVRDFIAGMTDQFFLQQFPDSRRPKTVL